MTFLNFKVARKPVNLRDMAQQLDRQEKSILYEVNNHNTSVSELTENTEFNTFNKILSGPGPESSVKYGSFGIS